MRVKKISLILTAILTASFASHADEPSVKVGDMGRITGQIPKQRQYGSGVYVSRNTYGMRANSVVAAFQANSDNPFDFPISGFNDVKALSGYTDRDSVSLYADNLSPPFQPWEKIEKANYTATSFTSTTALDSKNIRPGMLLDTNHKPKWSSYVISVEGNTVKTAGWVDTGNGKMGTPPNGVGLVINPITKIWATNFNAFLPQNGRSNSLVIQENAIINNKIKDPTAVNGLDTAILPQSVYGGTAAYLSRSADGGNKQQWHYGFISQGAFASFTSSDSVIHAPEIGFMEDSKAKNGMVFNGKNTNNSILWQTDGRVIASIDPAGLISKFGYKTAVAGSDMQLSDTVGRYLINSNQSITLNLPSKDKVFPGYTLKLMKVTPKESTVIFTAQGTTVNSLSAAKITGGAWSKEAVYDGTYWYIY